MKLWFEIRESDDPWRGRQPKYEKLVRIGPQRFALCTKLPSGESIMVPLGGSRKPNAEPC